MTSETLLPEQIYKECLDHIVANAPAHWSYIANKALDRAERAVPSPVMDVESLKLSEMENIQHIINTAPDNGLPSTAEFWRNEGFRRGATYMFDRLANRLATIPDGWVLVPKEPTERMIEDGCLSTLDLHQDQAKLIYEWMIAAAPKPTGDV